MTRSPFSRLDPVLTGIRQHKKWLILFLLAGVTAVAGYTWWAGSQNAKINYLTTPVKRGAVISTIPASGMVEPVSTVSLTFKNAEIVKKIHVKVGDQVAKGQLLAEQDNENLLATVRQATANLESNTARLALLTNGARPEELIQAQATFQMAQAALDLAETKAARTRALFEAGAVPQADWDQAATDLANAQNKLAQAQAALDLLLAGSRPEEITIAATQVENSRIQIQTAEKDLTGTNLVSPIDGIVSVMNGAEGQRATANNNNTSGANGFIVVNSTTLQLRAQVNEADIGRTQLGQKVEFAVNAFPAKTFTGRVSAIAPEAYTVSNVQIFDIIVQLDENYPELKAGLPANINIIVDRRENVLTIPKGCVTFATTYLNTRRQGTGDSPEETAANSDRESRSIILVRGEDGQPVPRRVSLGLADVRNYEVLKGLNEGETVITGTLGQPAASTNTSGNLPFMGAPRQSGGPRR
ncbi:MAG: efflux RND transporter periplasmic adaptor subunit [Heliobacteriaceae bacterium]|nr:efflux RND transporter periplasmic adaptor subunit [Heliobacteriaceae bacterium]